MSHAFECPHCWAPIPPEACDADRQVAVCSACGTRSELYETMQEEPVGDIDRMVLPRTVRIIDDPSVDVRVSQRRVRWFFWWMAPIVLSFAGIGFIIFVRPMLSGGSSGLPAVAFIVWLVAMAALLINSIRDSMTRVEVAMHEGHGSVFVGVLTFGRTRRFTYGPNTEVFLSWAGTRTGDRSGGWRDRQITLRSEAGTFSFGDEIMRPHELQVVAAVMQEAIRASGQREGRPRRAA